MLVPLAVGVALVWLVIVLAARTAEVTSFAETYAPEGTFEVAQCVERSGRIGSTVVCEGRLVPAGNPQPVTTELVGPVSAFGSETPRSGEAIAAYYRAGDTSRVYPVETRSIEHIRAIVALLPLVLLVVGLTMWMIGWILTRNTDPRAAERSPRRVWWPVRFDLRTRASRWILVGVVWFAVDRLLVDDLLGTAGLY